MIFLSSLAHGLEPDDIGEAFAAPGRGLANSVHDLSSRYVPAGAPALNKRCIFCHVPKLEVKGLEIEAPAAQANLIYIPLRDGCSAAVIYLPYGSKWRAQNGISFRIYYVMSSRIGPVSRICLGCHDGIIATNIYGNDMYNLNHHPIGFNLDIVQETNPFIANPDAAYFGWKTVRDCLYECDTGTASIMECPTCHSVHNMDNTGGKLLRISDENSNFCLTCHLLGEKTS